ncbi:helix-turn-helix transcriptional regulator [Mucilaginibacter sp.]|uniref:helix-turn-helix domain-containing protein n=1 Tax=Mucilaginibacter sp. TaxID=1882438 RepID=UPI003265A905
MNDQEPITNIGERIRQLRRTADLTQLELAETINRDVVLIIQLEAGELDPMVGDLIRIAKATNVSLAEFFSGVEIY